MTTYDTDILFLVEPYDRCSSRRLRIFPGVSSFRHFGLSLMIPLLALNFEESKYKHSTSGKGNRERCGGNVTRFHLNARTLFEISSKVLNDFQRFEDLHFLSHTFRITNFLSIYRVLGWSTSEVHFQFPIISSIWQINTINIHFITIH